jgi:hypothetical protein
METTRPIAAAPSFSLSRHCSKSPTKNGNAKAFEKKDSMNKDCSKDAFSSDTSSSSDCPLFMVGLPSDFKHNSALAAIASLIGDNFTDEDVDHKKKSSQLITVDLKSGGGKAKRTTRKRNNHCPYSKEKGTMDNGREQSTTLGEAQLFLNMWKI